MPSLAVPCFVLASASPRRLELLLQIGLKPGQISPADLNETPLADELPGQTAARLAAAKAKFVAQHHPDAVVLAADTVVACGRRHLPKAETEETARNCLILLSGRRHRVYTGVAVVDAKGHLRQRLVTSIVRFKILTSQEIAAYLKSGEWQGKAGGYAIQGRAGALIDFISGSYSNIVGLPLKETTGLLEIAGIKVWS